MTTEMFWAFSYHYNNNRARCSLLVEALWKVVGSTPDVTGFFN
jgi:hypothetical protein